MIIFPFSMVGSMVNTYRPLLKRTMGIGPPADGLLFGEPAFANGSDTIHVGKADGTVATFKAAGSTGIKESVDVSFNSPFSDLGYTELVVIPELKLGMLQIVASASASAPGNSVIATIPLAYSALFRATACGIGYKEGDPAISPLYAYLDGRSIVFNASGSTNGSRFTFLTFSLMFHY